MSQWGRCGLAALLAAAFAVPAWVQAADSDGKPDYLKEIDKKLGDIRDILKKIDSHERRIAELEKQIAELMRERQGPPVAVRRESRYPQQNIAERPMTGTIYFRNDSDRRAIVYINGNPYPVAPGQTATVRDIPLAPFTYEVTMEGTTRTYGPVRRTFDASRAYTGIITADLIP
jgi:uncharacterized protein YhaN